MTPFDQFLRIRDENPELGDPMELVTAHMQMGYVYASPLGFAMARPVSHQWSHESLSNPWDSTLSKSELTMPHDCWYVWAAIGELRYMLSLLPYPLPYIAFARIKSRRIRIYQTEKLLSHGRK